MRRHVSNAVYGALDYASYPLGMLAVTPRVLHSLGAADYGLWMVSTSVVSAGGILAAGFGDAGIQRVAALHSRGESASLAGAVSSLFLVSAFLGCVLSAALWIAAPWLAAHLSTASAVSSHACLVCLHIASGLIVLRGLEAVAVAAQRALQQYRGTVQLSITVRAATLLFAAAAPNLGLHTQGILLATLALFAGGAVAQFVQMCRLLGQTTFRLGTAKEELRFLLGKGSFAWLVAGAGVVFRQLDRILLGVWLGAAALAPYALCVQVAEPLFGLTASGLSFLFPHMSGRGGLELRRSLIKAVGCNLLLVAAGTALLLACASPFLSRWVGPAMAAQARPLLLPVLFGAALSGLSVTGVYAMQALERFRAVAFISLLSRAALLGCMVALLRRYGVEGLAWSRLLSGVASLLIYLPLAGHFRARHEEAAAGFGTVLGKGLPS
jgi:O-antigen/teichoic acid export membrane protein